jgi:tetratricopeptide (TPR) repeat protein
MSVQRKAIILAVAVLAAAFGGYSYFHRAPKLAENDFVLLTDFTNTTGDKVFDGTLRQGLATDLEQSTYLNVVSDQKISQTLRHLAQPAGGALTHDLTIQMCGQTESAAVIDGSIAIQEDGYAVGLQALNCSTGETLAQELVTSEDKAHVLAALGKATTEIRAELGEPHALLSQFDVPLVGATTSSLEALRAYSLGMQASNDSDLQGAIPFFQRAISLDDSFALAYAALGTTYYNLGQPRPAVDNLKQAYELRDRASEREKLNISGQYHRIVTGDLQKAADAYRGWAQTYPRDARPRDNLSEIYRQLGKFDKSLAAARDAIQVEPSGVVGYENLFTAYLALNRLDEARAALEQAQTKKLDSAPLHLGLAAVAFLQSDTAGMAREFAWGRGNPGAEGEIIYFEADSAAYAGRLAKANALTQQATASPTSTKVMDTAPNHEAGAALRQALFGNANEARKAASSVSRSSADRDVSAARAIALALAGDALEAQRLSDDLVKRFPEDTLVQFNYLPTIRASIFLVQNAPAKAIDELRVAGPYELGSLPSELSLMAVYVRAQSYLAAHDGGAATAEFQKILDHRGVVLTGAIGALAHLGLARAYRLTGDNGKARTAYEDFFALWNAADPDITILREAKSDSAKLQ